MKDFTHPKFPTIHIKLLTETEHFSKLADFTKEANSLVNFVPESSSKDAKYLYGIFDENNLVGVIDLIEDYPTKDTAYIHEFLLDDTFSENNLAETLYLALEKTAQETGITSIEVAENLASLPLWKNVNFEDNTKTI